MLFPVPEGPFPVLRSFFYSHSYAMNAYVYKELPSMWEISYIMFNFKKMMQNNIYTETQVCKNNKVYWKDNKD